MIRRSVAGAILGFALFVGSFAWSGFVALQTVFDPDRSREVAEELFDNDEVRAQLAENLAGVIGGLIPREVPVEDGVVDDVTTQLLNDPRVEESILAAFTDTHAAFLGEGDVPGQIDLGPVADVARERLVAAAPQLDTVVPASPPLTVPLPTDRVPNASPVRSFLQAAVPVLVIVAAAGAILALFATNDRPSILRRAGTWALTTTAAYLILGLAVPYLLRQYAPDQAEVLAALLSALLRSLLVPSIALGVAGLGLIGLSALWSSSSGREPSRAARRAPDPDAPHRRRTSSLEPARHQGSGRPDPYGRPAGAAPATYAPPAGHRAPPTVTHPAVPPPAPAPGHQANPYPDAGPQGSPYPDAGPQANPYPDAGSPYPDAGHQANPYPDAGRQQWGQAEPGDPHATSASVFADVPPPADPRPPFAPPAETPPPTAAAPPPGAGQGAPQDAGRSVFDAPGSASQGAPVAPATPPAPPLGARWDPRYGWILDPATPGPLPQGAVWVDGIGYVLPTDQQR